MKLKSVHSVRTTVIAAAVTGILAVTPAAAFADVDGSVITGTMVSATGAVVGGVEVRATVEPSPEQMADAPAGTDLIPTPIGATVTDASGAFALTVADVVPVAAASDEDGVASVVLDSATPEGQVFYRLRVRLTDSGQLVAVETEGVDPSAAGAVSRTTSLAAAGGPVVELVTTNVTPDSDSPEWLKRSAEAVAVVERYEAAREKIECARPEGACVDPDDPVDRSPLETVAIQPRTDQPAFGVPVTPSATGAAARAAALRDYSPDVWCGGAHWYMRKSKDIITRHPTLMDQATGAKTKGSFKYETTKNTSLEIGITNKAGNVVSTLGMTKGKTTTASVGANIGKKVNAEWWISFDFNLYDVMCQNTTTYTKWWSGYTELRPKGFSGSSSRRNWKQFTCQGKYKSAFGEDYTATVAKGRTTTRVGSFTWGSTTAGNMKLSQAWGSTQTISYSAINSTTSYSLCGYKGKWFEGVTKTRQV